MFEYILETVKNNPQLAAIYSGGLVGLFLMYSKTIIIFIKNTILNLISINISNITPVRSYDENVVTNLDLFLKNQTILFQNNFEITTSTNIKAGYGLSAYWLLGKLAILSKHYDNNAEGIVITTNIRIFFAKKSFIKKFQESVSKVTEIYDNKIKVQYGYSSAFRLKRNINSVFVNNNLGISLLNDVKTFINSQLDYAKNNILYKRNYLIYGKPGTGKSSLIFALASELNYAIKVINMSSIRNINDLLFELQDNKNTIFVFEDIDAMTTILNDRTNNSDEYTNNQSISTLSLSDILNILDGLYTNEGTICFFTTNHIEKLDSAFLRDGRMDYKLELTDLDNETANKMIKFYLNVDRYFKKDYINPALLQELILNVLNKKTNLNEFKETVNK